MARVAKRSRFRRRKTFVKKSLKRKRTTSGTSSSTLVNKRRKTIYTLPKKTGTGHWLTTSSYGKTQPIPKYLKMQGKQYYTVNDSWNLSSIIGQQAIYSLLSTWYSPLDLHKQYSNLTATANKIYQVSCTVRLMATNQSNACQFIEIYEVGSKQVSFYNSGKAWHPNAAWAQDLINTDQAAASAYIGNTPFVSRAFTTNYKVLKKVRYNLNPGETIEHMVYDKPHRNTDMDKYFASVGSVAAPGGQGGTYPGFTKFFMIVQWSAPYNDSTTKTQVAPGAGNVDYVITKQYTSIATPNTVLDNYYSTQNVVTAFTNAEDIMVDDSGAASALVNA